MKNRTKTYEKRVAHDFHFFAFKRLIFVLAYIRISRCVEVILPRSVLFEIAVSAV